MGKAIFVTGTGTDVGKTYVAGLMVKKLAAAGKKAGYYKAALSGAERDSSGNLIPGDVQFVQAFAGISGGPKAVSYIYPEAVSPHLAAHWNDLPVDFDVVERDFLAAKAYYSYLTMEGSGGILCPLRWDAEQKVLLDDLVKRLHLSVLVVANAGLGTINDASLTLEHLRRREIPVKGVLLNHWTGSSMEKDNRKMIEEMSGVPVLGVISDGQEDLEMDAERLAALYD